jgi:hypothetical protein
MTQENSFGSNSGKSVRSLLLCLLGILVYLPLSVANAERPKPSVPAKTEPESNPVNTTPVRWVWTVEKLVSLANAANPIGKLSAIALEKPGGYMQIIYSVTVESIPDRMLLEKARLIFDPQVAGRIRHFKIESSFSATKKEIESLLKARAAQWTALGGKPTSPQKGTHSVECKFGPKDSRTVVSAKCVALDSGAWRLVLSLGSCPSGPAKKANKDVPPLRDLLSTLTLSPPKAGKKPALLELLSLSDRLFPKDPNAQPSVIVFVDDPSLKMESGKDMKGSGMSLNWNSRLPNVDGTRSFLLGQLTLASTVPVASSAKTQKQLLGYAGRLIEILRNAPGKQGIKIPYKDLTSTIGPANRGYEDAANFRRIKATIACDSLKYLTRVVRAQMKAEKTADAE